MPGNRLHCVLYSHSSHTHRIITITSNWELNGLYYFNESLKCFEIFVHGRAVPTLPGTCFVQKDQEHLGPV